MEGNFCIYNNINLKAPLWQQVIDWFRTKNIIITIEINPTRINGILYRVRIYNEYLFNQKQITYREYFLSGEYNNFTDYYKAREQAILKAIELIKNDTKR